MSAQVVLIANEKDHDAAAALARALAGAGFLVEPGETFRGASTARAALALVSPAAETAETMRTLAFAAANAKPIVPVLLADLRPDGPLAPLLAAETAIDARAGLIPYVLKQILDALAASVRSGRVIAMLNMKGGVGKTVLTANLFAAAHLADERSIAFVDLDPQHNLSQYFLPPTERNELRDREATVYGVFAGKGPGAAPRAGGAARAAVPLNRVPGAGAARLDLICGDERLFEYTMDVRTARDKDAAFARWGAFIHALRLNYQAVVIDTNPCATFLTRCAISAADHVVAPVRPERYSLTGLNMLEWVAREIRERPVRAEEFSVLLNGVGDRVRSRPMGDIDAQTRAEIAAAPFFGAALLRSSIPYSGLLRATPDDRYAVNPINVTAMMRLAQRSLKESLTGAAAEILDRAAG